jgi:diamine N-acetyltransferase
VESIGGDVIDAVGGVMARVELREILTEGDRRAVLGLRRGPGQDAYLDSMADIFAEAEEEARAMPRQWAVHAGDGGRLVGFTMISDGIPEPIDADLVGPYFLWKLLIDVDEQNNGYGAATIDAVVAHLRTDPAPTRCSRAAPTGQARPAASTSATASPTRAG